MSNSRGQRGGGSIPRSRSSVRPSRFGVWEHPVLDRSQDVKLFKERYESVFPSILLLCSAVSCFLVSNMPLFSPFLHIFFAKESTGHLFLWTIGNLMSGLFLLASIRGFFYYRSAVPPASITQLTPAQQRLLGIDPLEAELALEALEHQSGEEGDPSQLRSDPTTTPSSLSSLYRATTFASPRSPVTPVNSVKHSLGRTSSLPSMTGRHTPGSRNSPAVSRSPFTGSPCMFASPSSFSEPITSESQLEEYLSASQMEQHGAHVYPSPQGHLGSPFLSNVSLGAATPLPPLRPYFPAYSPPTSSSPKTKVSKDKFGVENTREAERLLLTLRIEPVIDVWAERMRVWISSKILAPLVESFKQLDTVGMSMSTPIHVPGASAHATFAPQTDFWQSQQRSMHEIFDNFGENPVVQQRRKLERYMAVLGCTSRAYLLERINQLAKGGALSSYRWEKTRRKGTTDDSGELPTDAQILVHLFCTFMDLTLVPDGTPAPFSSRHYVVFPDKISNVTDFEVVIHQAHIHPPHFEIVCHQENGNVLVWPCHHGRNNLFVAISLFVYYVKTEMNGYIGQLSIAGSALDLERIITD